MRRKGIMSQHVRYAQIFLRLSHDIQEDYTSMTDDVFTELKEKLEEEVRNITRDLGVVITVEGEVTEVGRAPVLAETVRVEVPRVQMHLNEAHSILRQLGDGAVESA